MAWLAVTGDIHTTSYIISGRCVEYISTKCNWGERERAVRSVTNISYTSLNPIKATPSPSTANYNTYVVVLAPPLPLCSVRPHTLHTCGAPPPASCVLVYLAERRHNRSSLKASPYKYCHMCRRHVHTIYPFVPPPPPPSLQVRVTIHSFSTRTHTHTHRERARHAQHPRKYRSETPHNI